MSNWNDRANATPSEAPRDWKQAIGRGFGCRCPACGEGKLFGKFLKVKPECEKCGAEFSGHRADDLPPYITIMIVGHVIVPLFLVFERSTNWPDWMHMVIWLSLTAALTMALIQPVKGATIAYQWALRLHGFDPAGDIHDMPAKS
ncbi:MAG: DUF983 domain-containing protein [Methylobacterium sp.]|jgi:uncharacterized protein (DUF983 family)|nr:DUF983 domain-containing protein [Methylobacterium sp.]